MRKGETGKKRDRVQEELQRIHALRDAPRTPEALAVLEKALGDRSSFVVAAAATLCADAELAELGPRLPAAFARFMVHPTETDKGCKAKIALCTALYRNKSEEEEIYRRGLRHVQREPVWGGSQDTAAELRGLSALGLAQLDPPGVVEDLAELLADPEPTARALCARAIGATGREEGLPLLRFKVHIGDAAGEVLLECCAGLLMLSPRRALPFVGGLLERGDEARREAAALALGQSRREEALPLLVRYAEALLVSERKVALTAVAMLRSAAAMDYLVGLIDQAPVPLATMAARALALHRYDEALRRRVEEAARGRGDPGLIRHCAEAFAGR